MPFIMFMAKFEIDEFEERLTDNSVQQIEINTKRHCLLVYKFDIMDIII